MGIPIRPQHLKRYRDIGGLLIKYGRSDLVRAMGLQQELEEQAAPDGVPAEAEEFACDLERLGATYIKLGQLLSTRADLLPPAYVKALARLQDNVEPFGFAEVERIISEEVGIRLSKAFLEFDERPMAAASLGQVHRARLRDGREVAVKVQRPGIRQQVAQDVEILDDIAGFLERHTDFGRNYAIGQTVQELRRSLIRELDYNQEMANLITIGRNMEEFSRIQVAVPIPDYCSSRVLTMEYLHGFKITELSPVVRTELDVGTLAEELFRAYLKQILVDGLVHADPHPGNVFLTPDGNIALFDLGMVAHVPPQMQTQLVRLILAIAEGRGEDAASIAIKIGRQTGPFDEQQFRYELGQIIAENQNLTLQEIEVGQMVMRITQFAGQCHIVLPSELTMVGKALLNLDQIGRILDPAFNPNEAVRRHSHELLQHEMRKSLSMGSFASTMLDLSEFVQRLPNRLNEIMELIAKNKLQVQVDAIDERLLIRGFQKVANRITVGLILAALIVGAAFLMRVETQFRILGYPGLAILLFLSACAGGVALMISILWSDEK